jgi:hypothetical protein
MPLRPYSPITASTICLPRCPKKPDQSILCPSRKKADPTTANKSPKLNDLQCRHPLLKTVLVGLPKGNHDHFFSDLPLTSSTHDHTPSTRGPQLLATHGWFMQSDNYRNPPDAQGVGCT